MCYLIYLSTTSPEDLSQISSPFYHFTPPTNEWDDPTILNLLSHPHRWYIESRFGGCSCYFRHWTCGHFCPPEEWHSEYADNIESTKALYGLLLRLITEGYEVDLIDLWNNTPPEAIGVVDVYLNKTPPAAFWFQENYKFNLYLCL